ncbi:hypothetical protein [Marinobacter sp.]|uniref:hypothetical protein n=1 Tax=Marinobacter sp. TaxID=50741 RepID=UPI00384C5DBF
MNKLIYQTAPRVTLATNHFVNVPIILQYDETPLISIVREQQLGFTTEIPIFHQDGTYLAKVNGTRVYPTEAGKKAGIAMRNPKDMTVCEMDGKTLFEIYHEKGDAFRAQAELYTPTGFFVKSTDSPMPQVINTDGNALQIGGMVMSGNMFSGCRIGIWLKSDGSCSLGCN